MDRNRWLAAAVAVAVVLVAAVLAVALTRDGDHHMNDTAGVRHSRGHMTGTGPAWDGPITQMGGMPGMRVDGDGTVTMSEQAFIAMMIPHHQGAVDMARVEVERGRDAAAKALARRVIADQNEEISQMRAWYREWFGGDVPNVPMSAATGMMGMNHDTAALRSTDDPDRTFLRMMVPHHAGALLMADMLLAGEPREELAGLARRIVAAQSTEIGEMQRLRARIAPPLG